MRGQTLRLIGRLSGLTCFPALLIAAHALHAQSSGSGYEPPSYHDGETHYEKSEESFGRFNVVRYIEDCRDVPIMHFGCWLIKEAKLEWHDSTGKVAFTFVDNGASIEFKSQDTSADGKTTCLMQGALVGYNPKPSSLGDWQNLQPFIHQEIRTCTAIALLI